MPQQHQLFFQNSVINYYLFGNGPNLLLAFHGYGATGNEFSLLEKKLDEKYTIIAIDFPFHGATVWKESNFSIIDLLKILQEIISELPSFLIKNGDANESGFSRLSSLPINRYGEARPNYRSVGRGLGVRASLISFSMGGRVTLSLLQQIPNQIECAVLIAPDGLHVNFWYWLSTQTWLGNKLFKYSMKNPKWLFALLKIADKTRLLNKSIIKLVHYYMDDKQERLQLYERWTMMRKFNPKLQQIKTITQKNNIPLRFLFGKHDNIILSKRSGIFKPAENVEIKIIEAGHKLMQPKHLTDITDLLCK
ncbi:MAG: alpha/beta hydrolase [Parafilimonas sp.]